MSACCVSACKNRLSPAGKLKFYRIPSGHRPVQANRRRLWLRALQQANGGEVRGNVRVCGAHFITGEASMDRDSPDFVPSIFTSRELSSQKKERKRSFIQRFYSRRRRRQHRRKVDVGKEETQSPTESDDQSPVVMETEREVPSSPSLPQGEDTLRKEAEAEIQSTSNPNKTPRSAPVFSLRPDRMNPVVLLTPLVVSAGGYRCQMSSRTVTVSPQPVEHKLLHEEEEEEKTRSCDICEVQFPRAAGFSQHRCVNADEPAFSCNMCDRTFTTTHHLKRHKLLHVRDGRKCGKCGVLFCRRHNHVAFQAAVEYEQDSSSADEPQDEDGSLTSDPERSRTDVVDEDDRKTTTVFTPSPTTTTTAALPQRPKPGPLSKTRSIRHPGTVSLLPKPSSVLWSRPPPPPDPRISINPVAPSPLMPLNPPVRPELPSSLKIFSPHYLTSTLFHVRRNYEYILSKPKKVVVKEEPAERPLRVTDKRRVEKVRNEKVAYDLEIVV
ncbi:zinc finger protein 271-like [Scophthalmus maximus]|uniref:zinc finger protein 271-like n=1 Tax=Scophthalmus maximus TaxID=52904 RepID=UPI001FA8655E|nr:zinc finger protein 271-like [Scophthalmus maximus]